MIEVKFKGVRFRHNGPAPYTAEKFKTGFACILGADGINRMACPDKPGQTFVYARHVDEITELFNNLPAPSTPTEEP